MYVHNTHNTVNRFSVSDLNSDYILFYLLLYIIFSSSYEKINAMLCSISQSTGRYSEH